MLLQSTLQCNASGRLTVDKSLKSLKTINASHYDQGCRLKRKWLEALENAADYKKQLDKLMAPSRIIRAGRLPEAAQSWLHDQKHIVYWFYDETKDMASELHVEINEDALVVCGEKDNGFRCILSRNKGKFTYGDADNNHPVLFDSFFVEPVVMDEFGSQLFLPDQPDILIPPVQEWFRKKQLTNELWEEMVESYYIQPIFLVFLSLAYELNNRNADIEEEEEEGYGAGDNEQKEDISNKHKKEQQIEYGFMETKDAKDIQFDAITVSVARKKQKS